MENAIWNKKSIKAKVGNDLHLINQLLAHFTLLYGPDFCSLSNIICVASKQQANSLVIKLCCKVEWSRAGLVSGHGNAKTTKYLLQYLMRIQKYAIIFKFYEIKYPFPIW